jgi:hypothetical protein
MREQLANAPITALDGSIDGSQTTLTVLDGTVFPAVGNFRLSIEDEILLCTSRSSNTLTVIRGQEGTSGASHASTTPVSQRVTAGAFETWGRNNITDIVSPPLNQIVDDAGAPLVAAGFAWVNQGGASATDQGGSIVLRHPATANAVEYRALALTAPTPPYSYVAALTALLIPGTSATGAVGVGFRESSTGEMVAFVVTTVNGGGDQKIAVVNLNSPTSIFIAPRAEVFFACNLRARWFKIEDDGTNLKFYIGDGLEWIQIFSVGRTVFMASGPDQVWWGGANSGTNDNEIITRLLHWSRN